MSEERYSLGETRPEVIRAACREQCPEGFPMTIRSQGEWQALAAAWNQGIDSHLEALTERSRANAATGEVVVHPDELHVLCRRLFELGDEEPATEEVSDDEGAWTLRSAILFSLGLEEV